jgi:carboxyl-terminal processing protease
LAQPRSLIPASPQTLYHLVWQEVSRRIVDPSWLPTDWDCWLHKFDGRICNTDQAVERANEMLRSVKDWHTYMMNADEVHKEAQGLAGIGMTCGFKRDADRNLIIHADGGPVPQTDVDSHPIIRITPHGPAWRAGLRTGDTIVRVDGVSTIGCSYRWLWQHITGKRGSHVALLLGTSGLGLNFPVFVPREPLQEAPTAEATVLDSGIGYINLREFSKDSQRQMEEALRQLRSASGLIVDLRNNIGGAHKPAVAISSMFVEQGVLVRTEERIPGDPKNPLYLRKETFVCGDTLVVASTSPGATLTHSRSSRTPFLVAGKRVVVLIHGDAVSCAELFAGAVKDNGAATLIGTNTAGKGIGQLPLEMANGTRLDITVDRYFTPKGTWPGDGGIRVATGISPNIVVEPVKSVFDIGSADDNQLAAAVAYLQTQ